MIFLNVSLTRDSISDTFILYFINKRIRHRARVRYACKLVITFQFDYLNTKAIITH